MHRIMYILLLVCFLFCPIQAMADFLHPGAYTSGGSFPTGTVTIDTDNLEINSAAWPNAQVVAQAGESGVAVFTFDGGETVTANVTLSGLLPAVILFKGDTVINGSWSVTSGRPANPASGPGAGGVPIGGGGAGGGFGGEGGNGGVYTSGTTGGTGGSSYGDLLTTLEAGSGGSGILNDLDPAHGATHGGGAVEIGADGLLDLSNASLSANGQSGTTYNQKGSGGGSGGGFLLHAYDVLMNGSTALWARGGNGGNGGSAFTPSGGGGGGGRIVVLTNTSGTFTQGGATLNTSGGSPGNPGYQGDSGTAGEPGEVYTTAKDDAVGIPTTSGINIVPLIQMLLLN